MVIHNLVDVYYVKIPRMFNPSDSRSVFTILKTLISISIFVLFILWTSFVPSIGSSSNGNSTKRLFGIPSTNEYDPAVHE